MIPVDIEEQEGFKKVRIAEHQPQYETLPALVSPEGWNVSEWQLTEDERLAILDGATVYLYVWTFGRSMQPVNLAVRGVNYEASDEAEPEERDVG